MLTLQLLNSQASLNNFQIVDAISFVGNSTLTVKARLFQSDSNIRYIPDSGATFEAEFLNSDNSTLTKTGTNPFADDRSIIEFTFTEAETANLISQGIIVKVTEGSNVNYAIIQGALQKVSLDQGC